MFYRLCQAFSYKFVFYRNVWITRWHTKVFRCPEMRLLSLSIYLFRYTLNTQDKVRDCPSKSLLPHSTVTYIHYGKKYTIWRNSKHLISTNVKDKLSLVTPWRHIVGTEVQLHSFWALDAGEKSTSCRGCSTPRKELRYPLNRRLGGHQSRPRNVRNKNLSLSGFEPRTIVQHAT